VALQIGPQDGASHPLHHWHLSGLIQASGCIQTVVGPEPQHRTGTGPPCSTRPDESESGANPPRDDSGLRLDTLDVSGGSSKATVCIQA
jgi:hypothetical protein